MRSSVKLLQLCEDRGQNATPILQHVRVPETKNLVPIYRKHAITHPITRILCMLASIHFDDKLLLSTNKIHDIGPNRFLADEFKTAQTTIAQREPKLRFCNGGLSTRRRSRPTVRLPGPRKVRPSLQPSPR